VSHSVTLRLAHREVLERRDQDMSKDRQKCAARQAIRQRNRKTMARVGAPKRDKPT